MSSIDLHSGIPSYCENKDLDEVESFFKNPFSEDLKKIKRTLKKEEIEKEKEKKKAKIQKIIEFGDEALGDENFDYLDYIKKNPEKPLQNDFIEELKKLKTEKKVSKIIKPSKVEKNLGMDLKDLESGIRLSQKMCSKYVLVQSKNEIKNRIKGNIEPIFEEDGVKIYKKGEYYFMLNDNGKVIVSGYKEKIGENEEGEAIYSLRGLSLNKRLGNLRYFIRYIGGIIEYLNNLNINFITYTENRVIQNLYKNKWSELVILNYKEGLVNYFNMVKSYIKDIDTDFDFNKGAFYINIKKK